MLLQVNTLKIANSASFAKNWYGYYCLFLVSLSLCDCQSLYLLSVRTKVFNTAHLLSTKYFGPLCPSSGRCHGKAPTSVFFSMYIVVSTWCWPKLRKRVADNSWLYSAQKAVLTVATNTDPIVVTGKIKVWLDFWESFCVMFYKTTSSLYRCPSFLDCT